MAYGVGDPGPHAVTTATLGTGSSHTFEYDHENRLVETVMDSVTSTSVYNGDGLRMSHTVDQTTTEYIWDVASGLPIVLQDGTNTYVYGLALISATDDQSEQTYFAYDGLGLRRSSPMMKGTLSLPTPTTSSAPSARNRE